MIPSLTLTVEQAETVQAPVDSTLTLSGKAADAAVTGEKIAAIEAVAAEMESSKMPAPLSAGQKNQVLQSNGDGTTAWADAAMPGEETVIAAVDEWLTAHPEATTTVADGSVTRAKLHAGLQKLADMAALISASAPIRDSLYGASITSSLSLDKYTHRFLRLAVIPQNLFTLYRRERESTSAEYQQNGITFKYKGAGIYTVTGTASDVASFPLTDSGASVPLNHDGPLTYGTLVPPGTYVFEPVPVALRDRIRYYVSIVDVIDGEFIMSPPTGQVAPGSITLTQDAYVMIRISVMAGAVLEEAELPIGIYRTDNRPNSFAGGDYGQTTVTAGTATTALAVFGCTWLTDANIRDLGLHSTSTSRTITAVSDGISIPMYMDWVMDIKAYIDRTIGG